MRKQVGRSEGGRREIGDVAWGGARRWVCREQEAFGGGWQGGGNKKRAKKPLLLHPPTNEKRVSLLSQSHPLPS